MGVLRLETTMTQDYEQGAFMATQKPIPESKLFQ